MPKFSNIWANIDAFKKVTTRGRPRHAVPILRSRRYSSKIRPTEDNAAIGETYLNGCALDNFRARSIARANDHQNIGEKEPFERKN